MGTSRNWFSRVRRKFIISTKSADKHVIFLHSNASPTQLEEEEEEEQEHEDKYEITDSDNDFRDLIAIPAASKTKLLCLEVAAAVKIQACFRGHLARRAFKALRSLVKLQGMARGIYARKQARIALHFMHALVRLQVRVRARQLLTTDQNHMDH